MSPPEVLIWARLRNRRQGSPAFAQALIGVGAL
jgi:hypothetical protein